MRTINFSEARSNLKKVLDTVTADHTITIVTRRDSEDAVIMSLADYNAMQETLYLFGNPVNAERLHAAMAEAEASLPEGARVLGPKRGGGGALAGVIAEVISKARSKAVRLRERDAITADDDGRRLKSTPPKRKVKKKVASKAVKKAAISKRRA